MTLSTLQITSQETPLQAALAPLVAWVLATENATVCIKQDGVSIHVQRSEGQNHNILFSDWIAEPRIEDGEGAYDRQYPLEARFVHEVTTMICPKLTT